VAQAEQELCRQAKRLDRMRGRVGVVSAPRHLAWPDKAGLVVIVLIAGEIVTDGRPFAPSRGPGAS
jgi:hypothetical protein